MIEFDWDQHNIKHICQDYPHRRNTISDVESVFQDPDALTRDRVRGNHETRFYVVGKSNSGVIRVVVYIVNADNSFRPISCWPANSQTKRYYYENLKK